MSGFGMWGGPEGVAIPTPHIEGQQELPYFHSGPGFSHEGNAADCALPHPGDAGFDDPDVWDDLARQGEIPEPYQARHAKPELKKFSYENTTVPEALVREVGEFQTEQDYYGLGMAADRRGEPTPFAEDVHNVFTDAYNTLLQKHRDYGPKNISDSPGGPLNGLRVRMHDKLARINNLIDSGAEPENESLRDSFLDLMNYSAIAMLVLDGNWPSAARDVTLETPKMSCSLKGCWCERAEA